MEIAKQHALHLGEDRLTQSRWTYPFVGLPVTSAPSRIVPKQLAPAHANDGHHALNFSFEVASKDRCCFHHASTARRPWKQLPDALDKTDVPTMS